MLEAGQRGDIVAAWIGPRVEYLVIDSTREAERLFGSSASGMGQALERSLDQLGAEGWKLACRMGGGNQFVVFQREVPADAGTQAEIDPE